MESGTRTLFDFGAAPSLRLVSKSTLGAPRLISWIAVPVHASMSRFGVPENTEALDRDVDSNWGWGVGLIGGIAFPAGGTIAPGFSLPTLKAIGSLPARVRVILAATSPKG